MPRFAHMSDIHIGAFRQPELRRLVLAAFEAAMDRCMAESVSFVVMSGDIFDSNIPDLASVRRATMKMKEASDKGIRFYLIYGSHDFSPNYASIVDVLEGAGLFTLLGETRESDDRLHLQFVEDPSGAKLCGLSGKKLSLDMDDYRRLDTGNLEEEPGFKIFAFHGAIEELKPAALEYMDAMPGSLLPSGFDYYAGGHVHDHILESLPGRRNVAFPGPLFATDFTELSPLAHGQRRGFNLVDFDEKGVTRVEFVPVEVCKVTEIHYDASGKSSGQVSEELAPIARQARVSGQVVLLTVEGEMRSGKTSDVDLSAIRRLLVSSGPIIVLSNCSRLTSRESAHPDVPAKPIQATERELFQQHIAEVRTEEKKLRGEQGVSLSLELLGAMKEDRNENENKAEYQTRMERRGLEILDLKEDV
ncbi:MAG TPA: exonuclease SbcCD subunit D [Nitrososphaerales archaeon]|nr:exonuclease SbcCD subunit D [Nitrososphaerales archaeon]